MRIEYLADFESHVSTVAAWQQAQFGYLSPSVTLDQRTQRIQMTLNKGKLPTTFVAVSDEGALLGSAGIVSTTITHQHLAPWLSAVFVPQQHRQKGIGSALAMRAVQEAAAMSFDSLYLFTPHNESLYARLGWKTFERTDHNGLPIAIMVRPTSA